MRVSVEGDSPSAKALRGYLARHDFHLTGHRPDLVVRIEERDNAAHPILAGNHGELEQKVLRHLRKNTAMPIEMRTLSDGGGTVIGIVVPPTEIQRQAVETAVFRALLEISGQREQRSKKRSWKQILFGGKKK